MTNLNRKMAKGASWLILFRLTDRSIGFVSTLILARLLVPADFGLIAMAMSILAFVGMLSAFSFDAALVQNANAKRHHYDTAWTLNVLFGFLNALLLLALALPAAQFYGEPRVAGVMVALAAICAISGFANIGIVAFQKDLDLHKEFILGITKKLIAFAVTISLAVWLASYWSLIAGTMVSSITGVLMSYRMHPYRPRFSLQARDDLFNYSKWMLLNNLLISLAHRVPDFVIGKVAGPASLGLYTVAYEISNLPTTELVFPISRAVFPGYSKMADDREALRSSFLDVLAVILLVTVPAGLGIIVLAEPFVHVLLGAKWVDAIPLIQVLGLFGVLRAAGSNTGAVYLALGLPRILTYLTVLFLAIMFPALWLLVREHGTTGAAYAVLLAAAIQLPFGYAVIMRQLNIGFGALLAVIWRPVAAGVTMAGVILSVQDIWFYSSAVKSNSHVLELLTLVPFGVVVYVAATLGLWFLSGRPAGGESKLLSVVELGLIALFKRRT